MVVMDVKKLVLLIGALVIAAVTAVMAKNMFTGASAEQAAATPVAVPTGPEVLVATRSLPVGTLVDAEAVKFQPWPAELVDKAYFLKNGEGAVNPAELLGTVVRTELTAGQPVTQGSLIKPGDRGFLAAALGPGMRAITVPISSATSGVAGFIFPGDRVDMMLTQEVAGAGAPLKVTETIVRNLRVLAIDQRVHQKGPEGQLIVAVGGNITLEATPRIAEKIQVAQTVGALSFVLRSIADNSVELERAIASGTVKVPDGIDLAAERRMLLEIASKPADSQPTYSVGADVSRFQRRTVPAFVVEQKKEREANDPFNAMTKFVGSLADLASGKGEAKPAAAPRHTGPVVNVARGNNVTVVPVGAK
jgi:pilus assembly protein CpaB